MFHVTTLANHVIRLATVWKVAIFAKNFANVVWIVPSGSWAVVARDSAIRKIAHVFWLCGNVIQIYVSNVVPIFMMSLKYVSYTIAPFLEIPFQFLLV